MSSFSHRSMVWLLLFISFFLVCGCSDGFPRRYPVTGTIVFRDGSPVKTGTIEFGMPGSQWTASGKIERDGTFALSTINNGDGAIAGKHRVIVRQLIVAYYPVEGGHDHGKLVAEKYADYRTTDLEVEVKPDRNQFSLQIDEKSNQK